MLELKNLYSITKQKPCYATHVMTFFLLSLTPIGN